MSKSPRQQPEQPVWQVMCAPADVTQRLNQPSTDESRSPYAASMFSMFFLFMISLHYHTAMETESPEIIRDAAGWCRYEVKRHREILVPFYEVRNGGNGFALLCQKLRLGEES